MSGLLQLKEFNLVKIKLASTILAIGQGRESIARNLVRTMRGEISAGIAISRNHQLCSPCFPANNICPEYEPEILDAVFRRQTRIMNDNSLTAAERKKKLPFLILLDGVICDKRVIHDLTLLNLLVSMRRNKLFVLITTRCQGNHTRTAQQHRLLLHV